MTVPGASVHAYGKGEARAGRKMGHVTRVWSAKNDGTPASGLPFPPAMTLT